MPIKRVNKDKALLIFSIITFFLLILSFSNIKNYFSKNEVLGANTQNTLTQDFWVNFCEENPNYVPGWISLGNYSRALEIDPNYQIETLE